jgi:voltage-gated potassium channel Kch
MSHKTFQKRMLVGLNLSGMTAGCQHIEKLGKMVEAKANVDAKGIDRSAQQRVATQQPMTAGRDASNISPVVTINGSDSILLAIAGVVIIGMIVKYWTKSRKTIRAMVKAIEETPDTENVRAEVEHRAYRAGVAQEVWNHVHKVRGTKSQTAANAKP